MAIDKGIYYQIALELLETYQVKLEDLKIEVFREMGSGLLDVKGVEGSAIRLTYDFPKIGLLRVEWRDQKAREQNFMVAVCLLLDRIRQGLDAYYEG